MKDQKITLEQFRHTVNDWAAKQIPFLCVVDFEMENPKVYKLSEIDPGDILFEFNATTNCSTSQPEADVSIIHKVPLSLPEFQRKFETVMTHLEQGDTYLLNLTAKTEIKINASFSQLFYQSSARYKLKYFDQFLFFSPETFIKIIDGKIYTYPMKGTIDANLLNARDTILNDKKELAEHVTIVDLLRNDLSMVANEVSVSRFRYIEEIKTNEKNLLQVSSELMGVLPEGYKVGDILLTLLPAGSVSGAPKSKTVQIIRQAEGEKRGYYTGVAGLFDGKDFDSGVMIRFVEKAETKTFYRSGGGITTQSTMETEYQEVIDKVYVPLH